MTNEQAVEYIDSIMSNYDNPVLVSEDNPAYRLCNIWLSDNDIIALEMAKAALRDSQIWGFITEQCFKENEDGTDNGT